MVKKLLNFTSPNSTEKDEEEDSADLSQRQVDEFDDEEEKSAIN